MVVGRVGWSSGRVALALVTSFVVLRRALAESPLVRVLLDLLLDGDVLLLDGDVLLASVCICLRGCSSVRCKISWKCPSDIHVHEFAPERSGELVNVVGAA